MCGVECVVCSGALGRVRPGGGLLFSVVGYEVHCFKFGVGCGVWGVVCGVQCVV